MDISRPAMDATCPAIRWNAVDVCQQKPDLRPQLFDNLMKSTKASANATSGGVPAWRSAPKQGRRFVVRPTVSAINHRRSKIKHPLPQKIAPTSGYERLRAVTSGYGRLLTVPAHPGPVGLCSNHKDSVFGQPVLQSRCPLSPSPFCWLAQGTRLRVCYRYGRALLRLWYGFGTGRKIKIPIVYGPWDGCDG